MKEITHDEAIKWVRARLASGCTIDEAYKAGLIAIDALKKQIPYKPEPDTKFYGNGTCKCGAVFLDKDMQYCGNCGQKLDWEAVKE